MVVAVDVDQQVVQQGVEELRRGRDERRRAGVVAAAADPVLHGADDPADLRCGGPLHQRVVDAEKVIECDRARRGAQLDGSFHRGDVREDLDGDSIRGVASLSEYDLGVEQPARSGLQALDLGGGDRLGAQQEPREALQTDVRRRRGVQPPDGCFGVGQVGDEIGGKREIPPGERIGEVGVELAALTVAPAHTLERRGPVVSDQRCHNREYLRR
jgi:hypothetical protein